MGTPSIPDYKKPPKKHIEKAKAARAAHKACHGTWYAHTAACPAPKEA